MVQALSAEGHAEPGDTILSLQRTRVSASNAVSQRYFETSLAYPITDCIAQIVCPFESINHSQTRESTMSLRCAVATKKRSYCPDEEVTGKVWIRSNAPIPMDTITLKISGFENTKVMERRFVYDENNNNHSSSTAEGSSHRPHGSYPYLSRSDITGCNARTGTVE